MTKVTPVSCLIAEEGRRVPAMHVKLWEKDSYPNKHDFVLLQFELKEVDEMPIIYCIFRRFRVGRKCYDCRGQIRSSCHLHVGEKNTLKYLIMSGRRDSHLSK